jgi:hypothetical protein
MSWFAKLFGGGVKDATSDLTPVQQTIQADLAMASKTKPEVAQRLIAYVLHGADETGIAAVARQTDSSFARRAIAYGDISKPAEVTARNLFLYRSAGEDLALTIRYVQVLYLAAMAHIGRSDWSDRLKQQSPAVQMLYLALQNSLVTDKTIPDEPLPPAGMTRATALRLAQALGATEDDLLRTMILTSAPLLSPTEAWPLAKRLAAAMELERDYRERTETVFAHYAALGYSGGDISQTIAKLGLKEHPVYIAYLGSRLVEGDKDQRKLARSALSSLPVEVREVLVAERLDHPDPKLREEFAIYLAGLGSPTADATLQARLGVEKASSVRRVIEAHFAGRAMQTNAAVPDDDTGYTAIGGERIAIPPVRDFIPGTRPVFGATERAELLALIEADNARRQAQYEKWISEGVRWTPSVPKPIEPEQADFLIARLNGEKPDPRPPHSSDFWHLMRGAGAKWYRRQLLRLPQEIGLREFCQSSMEYLHFHRDDTAPLQAYMQAPNMDLRRIDQLLLETKPNWPKGKTLASLIGANDRYSREDRSREFARDGVWPMVAANLHVIEDAFSTAPQVFRSQSRRNSIIWLGLLPATPQRFLAPLLEIATSPKRESRAEARALLAEAPGIDDHLIGLLQDGKADTRRVAAEWLGDRRAAGAEAALRARLKTEKTEAVRAAMITALDRIGADISAYAGPAALLAEAQAGMKGAGAALPAWLGADRLAGLRWRDGSTVPEVVLHWWVRLAIKLKQPGGNGMFALYLDQLHPDDAVALGRLVFDAWVAESLVTIVEQTPWRGAREVLSNSSAETKGLLALARAVPSSHAAAKTRWYLKAHGQQTSQTSALLELLAAKADPPSLQVVLAAASRLKQKGVQKLAGDLVARIAEDNDWTLDQLADRSVPTLGLDETGRLDLPCGVDRRAYAARLDEALDLVLFNPEGRMVKALPTGDDEATVDAKAAFADAKKTLAQVVTIQRERLFDAMCSGRVWPSEEWLGDIHGHPVLRKASQQLVWLGVDAEGAVQGAFRPTPEGDFIGADDAPVDPAAFAGIRLAHAMLVEPATDAAWLAHLADHEVSPLFTQFGRAAPGPVAEDAEGIADRNGWITDTFTLRGLCKKLGYDRGAAEDGGHFGHYLRRFPVAGLIATINFSGNCLPEENMTAVIYDLRFARDRDGKPAGEVPPAKVPPVLLAECWHDYHAAASKGAFNPDWERLSPW